MQGRALIPDQDIANLPLVRIDELRLRAESYHLVDQGFTLRWAQTFDLEHM